MKNTDKKALYDLLIEFFETTDFSKRNVLNKNRVAELLKIKLSKLGYWRNKKRGRSDIKNLKRLIWRKRGVWGEFRIYIYF